MKPQLVIPTSALPHKKEIISLSDEDERVITNTFLHLAGMVHELRGNKAEDCLLLLTTCRNEWYTVNAMYAEARKWCAEGAVVEYRGFGDALDQLRYAIVLATEISPKKRQQMQKELERASDTLKVAATYLAEFWKKYELYFHRFEEVHSILESYAQSIGHKMTAMEFKDAFAREGNGPMGHELRPPKDSSKSIFRDRLLDWFAVVRPLTGLARTYTDDLLSANKRKQKSTDDYLNELGKAFQRWRAKGLPCPPLPTEADLRPLLLTTSTTEANAEIAKINSVLAFFEDLLNNARKFLKHFLPGDENLSGRFPLKQTEDSFTVQISGKQFERRLDMFVLIIDMINSVGDPYRTSDLKVKIDSVIAGLRSDSAAHSQTTYDDCRVLACDSFEKMSMCILRLLTFANTWKTSTGFAGIRMGLVRGEMLFEFDGSVTDLLSAAPVDSSENTIARSARVMGLDTLRWKDGALKNSLSDWAGHDLIFIERTAYETLSQDLQPKCRSLSMINLKGMGMRECWALQIQDIAGSVEISAAAEI